MPITIKTILASAGGLISYYYINALDIMIIVLIFLECLEFIIGIALAGKNKILNSKIAFWGLIKKLFYFVLVGIAFGIDYIISIVIIEMGYDINIPIVFGGIAIFYLIAIEIISILENVSELGINKHPKSRMDK